MTLEEKIDLTIKRLNSIFNLNIDFEKDIFVAWSGGKDSTVVLWVWREFLIKEFGFDGKVKALSIDTGLKFQEVIDHRDQLAKSLNVDLYVIRPEVDINLFPVAKDPVKCCNELKIKPLKRFIKEHKIKVLITGIRADENPARNMSWFEKRKDPAYIQLNPILHWSEMDVWSFHMLKKIPYCVLYDKGYRSLGCKPCTKKSYEEERDGRNREKEKKMEMLRRLGYF